MCVCGCGCVCACVGVCVCVCVGVWVELCQLQRILAQTECSLKIIFMVCVSLVDMLWQL